MQYLRQSTASQEVPLGYFVDSTDGNTEETGLTIANTDIKIWKTGATTLANKNSGGATHIANGVYYAVLDATDTDTIGPLTIFCHPSGALATRLQCIVLDEVVYDWMFGTSTPTTGGALTVTSGRVNADVTHIATAAVSTSSAQLGVNVVNAAGTAWGSGAITAGSIASDAITAAKIADNAIDAGSIAAGAITSAKFAAGAITATVIATDAIDADALAADAVTEIQSGLSTLNAAGVRSAVGLASANLDTQLTAIDDLIDTEVAAIKTVVDAIKLSTDNLPSDPADASVVAAAFGAVDAKIDTIDDFLDTEIAAIKAKTDSLTFTVAGQVDSNVQYVNDAQVTGNGQTGTEWGPA